MGTRMADEVDLVLYDAALAGRVNLTLLTDAERTYVVRRLTDRGDSARDIADRCHCSPRLVQRVRATL